MRMHGMAVPILDKDRVAGCISMRFRTLGDERGGSRRPLWRAFSQDDRGDCGRPRDRRDGDGRLAVTRPGRTACGRTP